MIFTSDNGPEVTTVLGMREQYGHDGARPWRGFKRDQWEGGHRVPLQVRWPGVVAPGSVCDEPVSLTDLMATCARISGAEPPEDAAEDSFDLTPALRGEERDGPLRPFLLTQTNRLALAIRKGRWKLLDHRGSGGNDYRRNPRLRALLPPEHAPGAPGQLYDLVEDPRETRNLYFERPDVVGELRALLEQARALGRTR